MVFAFGTRSLDLACGLDHTTVAVHLRMLRDEEDPLGLSDLHGQRHCHVREDDAVLERDQQQIRQGS